MVEYKNFSIAILGMLNQASLQSKFTAYHPILKKHFLENKNKIMERLIELENDEELKNIEDRVSVYNMSAKYDYSSLKLKFEEQIKALD
jgi:hypothetical protein